MGKSIHQNQWGVLYPTLPVPAESTTPRGLCRTTPRAPRRPSRREDLVASRVPRKASLVGVQSQGGQRLGLRGESRGFCVEHGVG